MNRPTRVAVTVALGILITAMPPRAIAAEAGHDLRAAAEPFETLTEIAFTGRLPKIDRAIADSAKAARGIRSSLPEAAAHQLDTRLADIADARRRRDRPGIALASIEGFRTLVSALPPETRVPGRVDVLDYVGFRYDADRRARPVRWDDMAAAVVVARDTWGELAGRVRPNNLAAAFDATLDAMDSAVATRDDAKAAANAKRELDQVDELETFFSRR